MKKILTTLLLVFSLSGVVVTAEPVGSATRSEATNAAGGHTLNAALIQRYGRRRRWRRNRRWARVHWNNGRRVGRRWNNRRWNNRRWNNRRWNNRRWNNGRGRGRRRAVGHQM